MPDWTDTLNRREAGDVAGFDGSNETKDEAAERHEDEANGVSRDEPSKPAETHTPQGFGEPSAEGRHHDDGSSFPQTN